MNEDRKLLKAVLHNATAHATCDNALIKRIQDHIAAYTPKKTLSEIDELRKRWKMEHGRLLRDGCRKMSQKKLADELKRLDDRDKGDKVSAMVAELRETFDDFVYRINPEAMERYEEEIRDIDKIVTKLEEVAR